MKKAYMHTLNGHPAMFDGEQICYLPRSRARDVLRDSYAQIKAERAKSSAWRKKMGFRDHDNSYDHVMFYV